LTETREKQAARFAASPDAWGDPEGIRTGADAAAQGRTRSDIVREALDEYLPTRA